MIFLLSLAAIIIVSLASYAGYLLWQVREKKITERAQLDLQQQKLAEKVEYIQLSIQTISAATLEGQCEISEAALRIGKLLNQVSPLVGQEDLLVNYPSLQAFYNQIVLHPILEARKQLPKQERMRWDLKRMKLENQFSQLIQPELKQLTTIQL